MSRQTPTPWAIRNSDFEDELLILSDETCVASVPIWDDDDTDTFRDQSFANAGFIVRACNAHDTLVATLRLTLRALNAPRFRVETTDSTKIASAIEAALRDAETSPYPEASPNRATQAGRNSALRQQQEGETSR